MVPSSCFVLNVEKHPRFVLSTKKGGRKAAACYLTSANSLHLAPIDDVTCAQIGAEHHQIFRTADKQSLSRDVGEDSVFRRNLTVSGVFQSRKAEWTFYRFFTFKSTQQPYKQIHYIIFTSANSVKKYSHLRLVSIHFTYSILFSCVLETQRRNLDSSNRHWQDRREQRVKLPAKTKTNKYKEANLVILQFTHTPSGITIENTVAYLELAWKVVQSHRITNRHYIGWNSRLTQQRKS